MKTQISSVSHRPERRYSGVYQQQGRMLLDADANEQMDIVRTLLAGALDDVVADGAPRTGGVVDLAASSPAPSFGRAYVDGIGTELTPRAGADGSNADPYADQADFPQAPPVPTGPYVLYLDVWERAVVSLEDELLLDPALHGADTSSRTQTMAQLKWCPPPAANQPPACESTALNPQIGSAPLEAALREGGGETGTDACDPCADTLDLEAAVGNYLFRLEVHEVQGDAQAPGTVVLKWSSENAAEQHRPAQAPTDFDTPDHAYEYYGLEAEKHLGVHLATGFAPQRGDLRAKADGTADYVRRWDGCCALKRDGDAWTLDASANTPNCDRGVALVLNGPEGAHGTVRVDDGSAVLELQSLRLTLALHGSAFVAGDYWLVLVRERAAEDQRVRVLSPTPLGIRHHYLTLGRMQDGGLVLDAKARRRLGFPPLSDLEAADVGYDNPGCANGLLAEAETVRAALDAICAIGAQHVGYDPAGCASPLLSGAHTVKDAIDGLCGLTAEDVPYATECETLQGATSVEQALDLLCREAEQGSNFCFALLRLFGRGVLCGLIPSVSAGIVTEGRQPQVHVSVTVTPGTFIDGRGCVVRHDDTLRLETDMRAGLKLARREVEPDAVPDIVAAIRGLREGTTEAEEGRLPAAKRRLITDRRIALLEERLPGLTFESPRELRSRLGDELGVTDDRVLAALAEQIVAGAKGQVEGTLVNFWLYLVTPAEGPPELDLRRDAPPTKLVLTGAVEQALLQPGTGPAIQEGATCSAAQDQAWQMFREVPCPNGNGDGAVCLGRIGVVGARSWASPDDREQVFPTPAISAVEWRSRQRPTYDELRAACTAEQVQIAAIELDNAPLGGQHLMADGSGRTGVLRLSDVVRGDPVSIALRLGTGVHRSSGDPVVIPAGSTGAQFSWSLGTDATAQTSITAILEGVETAAGFTAVKIQPLRRADGQPLDGTPITAGTSLLAQVLLTDTVTSPVTVTLSADSGLNLSVPSVTIPAGGSSSPTFTVSVALGQSGARAVRASVGQLQVSASLAVTKQKESKEHKDGKEDKDKEGKDSKVENDKAFIEPKAFAEPKADLGMPTTGGGEDRPEPPDPAGGGARTFITEEERPDVGEAAVTDDDDEDDAP